MKGTFRKIIAAAMCAVMLIGTLPLSCGAALGDVFGSFLLRANAEAVSGTCGADLTWEYDSATGTLSITGSGDMNDYWGTTTPTPWRSCAGAVTSLVMSEGLTGIGKYAFAQFTSLTSVVIPDTVTSIRQNAFLNCSALSQITFPASLRVIGDGAFQNCSALSAFTLPASLQSIGADAFRACRGITALTLPDSLTQLGTYAFYDCSSIASLRLSNAMTAVPKGAFSRCSALREIDFGSGVTEIGEEAFSVCSALSSVTLPQSLVTIGYRAFLSAGLTAVSIPASVTTVASEAFRSCKSLTSVVVPATVENLSTHVFYDCSALASAALEEGFTALPSFTFYGCGKLTDVTLPVTLTSIGNSAFYNCKLLESIDIPDGVGTIGKSAFSGCAALKDAALPEGLSVLSEGVFRNCTSLESVTFPPALTTVEDAAFYGCSSLEEIVLPDTVTSFGNNVFSGCSSLVSAVLPDRLQTIGTNTFYECTSLTQAVLPSGITTLPGYTFYGCRSLQAIDIPETVTEIGQRVFYDCRSLREMIVPDAVQTIGELFCQNCSMLERVVLPEALTSIESNAFYSCAALTDVTLPSGLEVLPSHAFYYCTSLASIELPQTLTTIGSGAFTGCGALQAIEFPDTLTSVGISAFAACGTLSVIELPDGLTSLPKQCFSGCAALNSVSFPASLRSIGESAFSGCAALTDIDLPSSLETIGADAFKNTGLVRVTLPEGLTSLGLEAFYNCDSLESIRIPDSVTSIGSRCFQSCGVLSDVRFSQGMTSIPDACFHGCPALRSFEIPAGVTSIGGSAFTNCPLQELVLPDGLRTIGDGAFQGIDIFELAVPASVVSIGSAAFGNTVYLSAVEITDLEAWLQISFGGRTANPLQNGGELRLNGRRLQVISVPMGIEEIKPYAFTGCSSVVRVDLPNTLQSIGTGAFQNCANLKTFSTARNLTALGASAFEGCASLEQAHLYCKTIGNNAFYGCASLKDVKFLNHLTTMGTSAFYGCASLKKVILPDTLDVIPTTAFSNCSSLVSVAFGSGLTKINSQAFQNCVSLSSVVLPASTQELNQSCFSNCPSIQSFIVHSATAQFKSIPLGKTPGLTIYGIPGSPAQTYASDRSIPFEPIAAANFAAVTVLAPEGDDLTDACAFIWKNEAGDTVATGRFLTAAAEGEHYTCETILDAEAAEQFAAPAPVNFTPGDEAPVIRLTPHEQCVVRGTLTDREGTPIPGASVQIVEQFNEKHTASRILTADEAGSFSCTVCAVALKLIYTAEGYFHSERDVKAERLADGVYDADEQLIRKPENAVTVYYGFTEAVTADDTPDTLPLPMEAYDRIELYDETVGAPVEDYTYADALLTAENAEGHTLRLTAYPADASLLPGTVSFVYTGKAPTEAYVTYPSKGGIRLSGLSMPGISCLALLFDSAGRLVRREGVGSTATLTGLDAGNYTLVLIQNGSSFSMFDSLDRLAAAGLAANEHYIRVDAAVADGVLTQVKDVTVPSFRTQDLVLPQVGSTSLYLSRTDFYPGQLITVTAAFEMAAADTGDYSLSFRLPEGLSFSDGSVTVNGMYSGYTLANGVLTVPMAEPGTVRFFVNPTVSDILIIDAALRFTQDGETFTQYFGSASMVAAKKGLNVVARTPVRDILVSGCTLPGADVTVYLDQEAVAETIANNVGSWHAALTLPGEASYSRHVIYAEIRNVLTGAQVLKTESKVCEYNINANIVESIEMPKEGNAHGFHADVILSPVRQNPIYFNVNKNNWSTYRVRLHDNDPARVKSVYVYLKDAFGDVLHTVTCGYDEKTDSWVGAMNNGENREAVYNLSTVSASFLEYEAPQIVINEAARDDALDFYNSLSEMFRTEIENGNITMETLPVEDYLTPEQLENGISAYDEETGLGVKLIKYHFPAANELGDYYVSVTGTRTDLSDVDTLQMRHYFDENGTEFYSGTKQENAFSEITVVNVTEGTMLRMRTAETPEVAMGRRTRMHVSGAVTLTLSCIGLPLAIIAATAGASVAGAAATIAGTVAALFGAGAGIYDINQMKQAHDRMLEVFAQGLMSDCEEYRKCIETFGPQVTALDMEYDQILSSVWDLGTGINLTLRGKDTGETIVLAIEKLADVAEKLIPALASLLVKGISLGLEAVVIFFEAEDVFQRDQLRTKCENVTAAMLSCPQCSEETPPAPEDNPGGDAPYCPIKPLLDPSGYVYEAVPSNRVEGAVAKLWYRDAAAGADVLWDAENYDQTNPQITDGEGRFQWDVPVGKWLVTLEKEGYLPADSRLDAAAGDDGYLPVPPPQMDVNTAMISTAAPTVEAVCVYEDSVRILFSQYMQPDSVNAETVVLSCGGETLSGVFAPADAEYDYAGENRYASVFTFTPASPVSQAVSVHIENAVNYAGTAMAEAFDCAAAPGIAPEALTVPESVSPPYNSGALIHVAVTPAAAGAGKTVSAVSTSPAIVEVVNNSVVLDENGEGNIMVSGALPGGGEVIVTLDGTDFEKTVSVNVGSITQTEFKCEKVASSVESYSVVPAGTQVTLTTATEGAEIYYTLDGSCPCEVDSPSRLHYTGPITVNENMFLIAYAVKDGYEDSNTAGYVYLLKAPEHNYIAAVTPPTCTEGGFTTYTCSDCGDSYTADYTDALGHAPGSWTAGTPASCTAAGTLGHARCARCGKDLDENGNILETTVIRALGHDYGAWIGGTPASCEAGTAGHYHCARCGLDFDADRNVLETTVLPALGHDCGSFIAPVPATCTAPGTAGHYHCARCGKDFDAQMDELTDISVPAAGHRWGEWTTTKEPTDAEAGEETRVCGVCQTAQTRRIPATGEGLCEYCHKRHEGFFGKILGFFHRIILFFRHLFR